MNPYQYVSGMKRWWCGPIFRFRDYTFFQRLRLCWLDWRWKGRFVGWDIEGGGIATGEVISCDLDGVVVQGRYFHTTDRSGTMTNQFVVVYDDLFRVGA